MPVPISFISRLMKGAFERVMEARVFFKPDEDSSDVES